MIVIVLAIVLRPVIHSFFSASSFGGVDTDGLRVATYNVNFGLAGQPATTQAVINLEVDVLLLQETNAEWQRVLSGPLRSRFPYQHWVDAEHYPAGGMAILSRYPLHDISRSESDLGWFPAIAATVAATDGDVRVVNLHLKPVSTLIGYFTTPADRAREVRAHLEQLLRPGMATLVAGDLNEARGGSLDELDDAGFRDGVSGELGRTPTWRWPLRFLTLREQLDHLLVDAQLEVAAIKILTTGDSDHLPVVATLRRR